MNGELDGLDDNPEDDAFLSGGGDQQTLAATATPTSGSVPLTREGGLDITALMQAMRTGSQGRPMPSFATDAASTGSRIAKILERNLKAMEDDKGYGRIGAALSQDIASGGRAPYAMVAEQLRGREAGQAVNIANAITGLERRLGSGGAGTLQQMATMLQRRTEQAAREGNSKAGRINEMVRAASLGFEDPAMAQASIYAFLAKSQKSNPAMDVGDLPQLMSDAIMDARRNGLARKSTKGSGSGGGGGDSMPSLPMTDGEVDFDKPFPKPKTAQERTWNMSSVDDRKEIFKSMKDKATGKKAETPGFSVTTNADGTTTTQFGAGPALGKGAEDAKRKIANESLATADRVHGLVSRIEGELNATGATSIGVLGNISSFTGGLKAQVNAALDSMGGKDAELLKSWRADPSAAFKSAFKDADPSKAAWLLGDNSEGAQRIRTNVILLAYAHSKAMDPSGRIARDDVENTLRAIGESSGSPAALRVAMRELLADMKVNIESRWLRTFNKKVTYAPGQPIEGEDAAAAPPSRYVTPTDSNPLGIPGIK